ncbi:MAG TPA: CpaF family protein [Candidatus Dormibacteraeota bacterium]
MSLSERMQRGREPLAPSGERDLPRVVPAPAAPAEAPPAPRPAPAEAPKPQAGPAAPAIQPGRRLGFSAIKAQIQDLLVERHATELDVTDREAVRSTISSLVDEFLRDNAVPVSALDHTRLVEGLLDDVLGLGPLEPLLQDPSVTEIMINHHKQIYIERAGRIELSPVAFEDERQLRKVIDRIVSTVGRRVDESSPMCDARLRDGSRVNVVVPPLVLGGACMTIRKFAQQRLSGEDLVEIGTMSPEILSYLEAAVRARLTIIVSGGTSSGKTTLLNVLSGFIQGGERLITIEDSAELQLQQPHLIRMESRPASVERTGAVEIRDLVRNALRMRPDRIIVGECRGGEAIDMLQAMNTGHEGSLSSVHANSPEDAFSRLETMVLMGGTELPARAILKQIASAIDVVVQMQRVRGGTRKITSVGEVTGLGEHEPEFRELFTFKQVSLAEDGSALGYHTGTGFLSQHLERFKLNGSEIDPNIFQAAPPPESGRLY